MFYIDIIYIYILIFCIHIAYILICIFVLYVDIAYCCSICIFYFEILYAYFTLLSYMHILCAEPCLLYAHLDFHILASHVFIKVHSSHAFCKLLQLLLLLFVHAPTIEIFLWPKQLTILATVLFCHGCPPCFQQRILVVERFSLWKIVEAA